MKQSEIQKLLKACTVIIEDNTSSGGSIVTETNSSSLLASILDLALPTEDQYSLVRFLKGGIATTVENDQPLPVVLSTMSGEINVTAGDINVQISHTGTNFDSTRIGDGTNTLVVNADGSINVSGGSVLAKYSISRGDDSGTLEYYGSVDVDSNWYILEVDTLLGTYKYANGSSNFLTNWGNRATLIYDEFNNLTW